MLQTFLKFTVLAAFLTPGAVWANDEAPAPAPSQDYCIDVMSGFPNDDITARYQFFRLAEKISVGATPEFKVALDHYGADKLAPETPVIEVIEVIANPVIRQAAPELVVSNMGHIIEFNEKCSTFIRGQINSLIAFNSGLTNDDSVIAEDALYLRQILSDSLMRLEAEKNDVYATALNQYATSLVTMRDNIEFQAYASEIGEIEALYMTDLDGRLARSNDIINNEVNRETLGDAVELSDDMNQAAKEQYQQRTIITLIRILTPY